MFKVSEKMNFWAFWLGVVAAILSISVSVMQLRKWAKLQRNQPVK